jgi:hypothetical protein
MIVIRFFAWLLAGFLLIAPLNWARLGMAGDLPSGTTLTQTLTIAAAFWLVGGLLAYFLLVSARKAKLKNAVIAKATQEQAANETRFLQQLAAGDLIEMTPSRVVVKSGEKAYASIAASLHEIQTVGFSAGTSGVSVRVAKGITLRSSGTKGKAVKDLVTVASGELVVTDQRIIFAGDNKSLSIGLENLLQVTPHTDGFTFADNRSNYTFSAPKGQSLEIFRVTLNKVLGR